MHFSTIVLLPFVLAGFVAAGPITEKRVSFTLQNGKDAQALNREFPSLNLHVRGGLTCVALPLVNSPGTSVTCDTEEDAAARIARTGVSGGLRGRELQSRASFKLKNDKDAQALNRKFKSLKANSNCKSGENACVNGAFAQCANGKFVTFPCNAGLKCFALPLVLSPGTSIACDTEADAKTRIKATGAGGLFGRDLDESA